MWREQLFVIQITAKRGIGIWNQRYIVTTFCFYRWWSSIGLICGHFFVLMLHGALAFHISDLPMIAVLTNTLKNALFRPYLRWEKSKRKTCYNCVLIEFGKFTEVVHKCNSVQCHLLCKGITTTCMMLLNYYDLLWIQMKLLLFLIFSLFLVTGWDVHLRVCCRGG